MNWRSILLVFSLGAALILFYFLICFADSVYRLIKERTKLSLNNFLLSWAQTAFGKTPKPKTVFILLLFFLVGSGNFVADMATKDKGLGSFYESYEYSLKYDALIYVCPSNENEPESIVRSVVWVTNNDGEYSIESIGLPGGYWYDMFKEFDSLELNVKYPIKFETHGYLGETELLLMGPATEKSVEALESTSSQYKTWVGSKEAKVFHSPDCISAKRINVENEIWFSSALEASMLEFDSCAYCENYCLYGW